MGVHYHNRNARAHTPYDYDKQGALSTSTIMAFCNSHTLSPEVVGREWSPRALETPVSLQNKRSHKWDELFVILARRSTSLGSENNATLNTQPPANLSERPEAPLRLEPFSGLH